MSDQTPIFIWRCDVCGLPHGLRDMDGDQHCACNFEPSLTGAMLYPANPDTEIDREARLIVDGEYRRRREAEREAA